MKDLLFHSPTGRRRHSALGCGAAAFVAVVACTVWAPAAHSADDAGTLKVYWKEGLRLDSADKQFQLKIGGRVQNDWDWFTHEDDVETKTGQNADDGTEFRRARLYIAGTMYQHVIFMAEYDFAQGESAFKDVYVGLREAGPIDLIRVGHYKEPFSLEELTSDNFTTFMERSLPDIFTPQRNVGLSFNQGFFEDRMTVAAGTFRDADDITGDSVGDNFQFTGRITGLPLYADEGNELVHLGFSYSRRNPDNDTLRVRQRPEVHRAPRWVDTGDFAVGDLNDYAFEAAGVWGPFSVQTEYMLEQTNTESTATLADLGDPSMSGWYIFGSWIVTGEHRTYKLEDGVFGGVNPKANFLQGGPGAIEVALRYSNIDLDDGELVGGEEDDITVGANWYLNPNARVMFNYVYADVQHADAANAFMVRFQIHL